jgi:hypothetical protein
MVAVAEVLAGAEAVDDVVAVAEVLAGEEAEDDLVAFELDELELEELEPHPAITSAAAAVASRAQPRRTPRSFANRRGPWELGLNTLLRIGSECAASSRRSGCAHRLQVG